MEVIMLADSRATQQHTQRLEPMVPKGLGTGHLECLTSYLCRLANHHWLTPYHLRRYAETHYLDEAYGKRNFYAVHEPATINSYGHTAFWVANALNNGTGRADLLNLTLHHWAPALDRMGKGLLYQSLRWCSACWKDDHDLHGEPYARLSWLCCVSSCCSIHGRLLSDKCSHCAHEQCVLPNLPALWICQACGKDLFSKRRSRAVATSSKPMKRQLWLTKSIEKLIERTCANGEPIAEGCIERVIDQLAVRYAFGSSTELAKKLNIQPGYLKNWRYGRARPTLLSLADLAYRLDIPLDQLLIDTDVLTDPALWRDIQPSHFVDSARLSTTRKNEIRKILNRMISKPPKTLLSVIQLSEKFNISYTTLSNHFPNEYEILKQRASDWRKKRTAKDQEERIRKLNAGVRELIEINIYPSERQLRDYGYLKPSDLRRPEILIELKRLQTRYIHLMSGNRN